MNFNDDDQKDWRIKETEKIRISNQNMQKNILEYVKMKYRKSDISENIFTSLSIGFFDSPDKDPEDNICEIYKDILQNFDKSNYTGKLKVQEIIEEMTHLKKYTE